MKKYQYCFIMAATFVAPHVNEYAAVALFAGFMGIGVVRALKNQ